MKEKFVDHSFTEQNAAIIVQANVVVDSYRAQGFKLTLRQLYYQFIARDLLPDSWADKQTGSKNSLRSYKKLGNIINDARLAGLVDWDMIEDRGRETVMTFSWVDPEEYFGDVPSWFKIDMWKDQTVHFEVMVEKDALAGILIPVCRKWQVPFTANRGYSSSSTMKDIAERIIGRYEDDKEIHVLYLGDHDPSGIDMTRDVTERLQLFTRDEFTVDVSRLALNIDQVRQWNPPVNPAKETDARFSSYRSKFGEDCWELDAVEPATLADLVEKKILEYRDEDRWDETLEEQRVMRDKIRKHCESYEEE